MIKIIKNAAIANVFQSSEVEDTIDELYDANDDICITISDMVDSSEGFGTKYVSKESVFYISPERPHEVLLVPNDNTDLMRVLSATILCVSYVIAMNCKNRTSAIPASLIGAKITESIENYLRRIGGIVE